MAGVTIRQVSKHFGPVRVLDGLDLEINDGEFVVLVGPSGCGKTTLLRMIAGLESVSGGQIMIGERDVTWVAPKDRDIAMVFQSYALYPHMSASENMSFGLKLSKTPKGEIESRVAEAARMLKIEHLLERKPRELSGGQRQRVAMGRAIVRRPALYLFDEPLSNLDAQLRTSMRTEIKRMHLAEKKTVVYVTHDQIEALTLADRIVAMNRGEIQQIGSPDDLYNRPSSVFVASFIGSPSMSFLRGNLVDGGRVALEGVATPLPLPPAFSGLAAQAGTPVLLGLRPEAFAYAPEGTGFSIDVQVNVVEPCGAEVYVIGEVAGQEITARCVPGRVPPLGAAARFEIALDQIHLFDAATEWSLRP
ncbi:sn-glycerol-3-phosphate ABC transporter ATP-binding protein UgpC [Starkeya sp. 3C]|uniref:Sn-glycerol-3-phosphate ABC transporter ATP-binding protein UgpC n=1 Tax=Ancylobacter moscoviensis TaxID=2597768 RepID=A0ABY3DSB4_9HYPH|nr:sn-glycerol-3-phosphate ABC transporter ATP-binding protein UgpC [Ancylobacter moscoviensis]TSJ62962.1 sn-glycerol-3-phosphate ABC transporter ATP-binding protein UgpC [Ancylobacter moscoviensis]